MKLSHTDDRGRARMVDIGEKPVSRRRAVASGRIGLQPETIELIRQNAIQKGDVLAVARVAGIGGGKRAAELIPLCHNIPIDSIAVDFRFEPAGIRIEATAAAAARTGAEMEALTAVALAALAIYDMCKAVDKKMVIGEIRLEEKTKHALPG
jgi:cyclic pyranopterin phosphate synthase